MFELNLHFYSSSLLFPSLHINQLEDKGLSLSFVLSQMFLNDLIETIENYYKRIDEDLEQHLSTERWQVSKYTLGNISLYNTRRNPLSNFLSFSLSLFFRTYCNQSDCSCNGEYQILVYHIREICKRYLQGIQPRGIYIYNSLLLAFIVLGK